MNLTLRYLILVLLSPVLLFSNTIATLTDNGTSAKVIALGSIEGVHSQASVVHENPAGMGDLERTNVSVFYTKMADQETNYSSMSAVFQQKETRVGFGFTRMSVPNLDFTGELNNKFFVENSFEVNETLYTAAVSHPLHKNVDLGVSSHYYLQQLYLTSGRGFNMDLGLKVKHHIFTHSMTVKNILRRSKVSYDNNYGDVYFPLQGVFSTKCSPVDYLSMYSQIKYNHTSTVVLKSVGLEVSPLSFNNMLDFYVGWTELEVANLLKDRVSLGLGLTLANIEVQFVYEHTEYSPNDAHYGMSFNLKL
jgi:hypothetical protein